MTRTSSLAVIIVLGFVVINAAMLLLPAPIAIDATQSGRHSIDDATRDIIGALDTPVTITLYQSQDLPLVLPQMAPVVDDVKAKLRSIVSVSKGKITLKELVPQPFSQEEDNALSAGLTGVPINNERYYFGIILQGDDVNPQANNAANTPPARDEDNATANQTVIPFITSSRRPYLEYDIARALSKLQGDKRITVGLVSGVSALGFPFALGNTPASQPWEVFSQMGEIFDLREITVAEQLAEVDPTILIVLHPTELTDAMLYAIDQYALKNGQLIILADPFLAAPPSPLGTPTPTDSTQQVNKIIKSWNLVIEPSSVVLDQSNAVSVTIDNQGGSQPYVAWWRPMLDNARDVPVFANLQQLLVASPGSLRQRLSQDDTPVDPQQGDTQTDPQQGDTTSSGEDSYLSDSPVSSIYGDIPYDFSSLKSTLTVTPLLLSNADNAMLVPQDMLQQPNPQELLRNFDASGHDYVIAAMIEGNIRTAFSDGPPAPAPVEPNTADSTSNPDATNETTTDGVSPTTDDTKETYSLLASNHLTQSQKPLRAFIVNDVDFLQDRFWGRSTSLLGSRIFLPNNSNGNFLLSMVEQLSGNRALSKLRARALTSRPFTRFEKINQQAQLAFQGREQELQERLVAIQTELDQLSSLSDTVPTTDETENATARITAELVETRQALRAISLQLRRDLENLQTYLSLINIALIPTLLVILFLWRGYARWRKTR